MKDFYVYILTNERRTVLYTGMTNDLQRRVSEHWIKFANKGFTKRYNVNRLVYFETYREVRDAIAREKQIKGWLRCKKEALISSQNPKWSDLTATFFPRLRGPSLRSG